jgi:hypothetical protein
MIIENKLEMKEKSICDLFEGNVPVFAWNN